MQLIIAVVVICMFISELVICYDFGYLEFIEDCIDAIKDCIDAVKGHHIYISMSVMERGTRKEL